MHHLLNPLPWKWHLYNPFSTCVIRPIRHLHFTDSAPDFSDTFSLLVVALDTLIATCRNDS